MTDPLPHLVAHAARLRYAALPRSAVERMKVFILDTLGVGAAGANGANVGPMNAMVARWGLGDDARVWGSGLRLPAPSAAFINAYRTHALEFDCLHERAVLHPMAAILAAVLAYCDRRATEGVPVTGEEMIAACVAGVDVATFLGFAARGPVRFFRPSTAGGFGAAAAIANLAGYDEARTADTFGIHDRIFLGAVTLLMGVLVAVIAADVVARYGFSRSLLFANELSRMCFIWMTFLVMPLGIARGLHVAVTTVPDALSEPLRKLVYRACIAAVFVLMIVVFMGAVVSIRARSFETLNTLPVSAAWYFYPLALGAAWSLVHLVARFIDGKAVERHDGGVAEQALP